ncbi:TRAP transporter small permease [Desulforhopalus sp. 52FAK]
MVKDKTVAEKESQEPDKGFTQTSFYSVHPRLRKVINVWITFWACVFFVGVSVNFIEIVTRVFFSSTIDLMYDIPIWCTIWSTLMVTGPILLDNEHVSIDAITIHLRGLTQKIILVLNALITLAFGIIITVSGCISVSKLYQFGTTYPRSIPIPSWWVEICVPISMFIFSCFAFYDLLKKLRLKMTPKIEMEEYM